MSTAAQLTAPENPVIPKLVNPDGRRWHKHTRAWWKDVWSSAMAGEYLTTDTWGLSRVAVLVDDFYRCGDMKLRAGLMVEIRMQEQRYGLSAIDRRRLQWEVAKGEEAERSRKPREPEAPRPERVADPRSVLKSVS